VSDEEAPITGGGSSGRDVDRGKTFYAVAALDRGSPECRVTMPEVWPIPCGGEVAECTGGALVEAFRRQ